MRIKDLDTGIIYERVRDISIALNIKDKSNIYTHLRGKTKSVEKHHFAYIDADGEIVKPENKTSHSKDAKSSILKYMVMINTAFNFQQWGHWISLKGLIKVFDIPDGEVNTFCKVLKLNFELMHSSRAGSFNCYTSENGLFFYTPLFNQKYWSKVVEIKKQVPVITDVLKRGPEKEIDYGYQMLLGVKLIPTAEDFNKYKDIPKANLLFDFDAVKPMTLKQYKNKNKHTKS